MMIGEGNGTPLQYSCLENPMDGGAWWAAVHGVARSQTRLSDFTFTFHFQALEKEMATYSSILAWRIWATVYGFAQSRTRLKRLSSSSSRHDNIIEMWSYDILHFCDCGLLCNLKNQLHLPLRQPKQYKLCHTLEFAIVFKEK